jgi:ABC-type bacteriocin/lantibiotic exporter with double-glycine peptidase domain
MRNFLFLFFILLPTFVFSQRMPTLEDEQYKTACGPIACVVALDTLGIETTLSEMAKRCGWEQDKYLPLENLQNALKSYHGIDCQIAKLSPKELCQLLKDDQTVVILALRKNTDETDHAVCAVDVQENDQVIKLIDYPELTQRKLVAELADAWDGVALVVRITPFYRACGDFAVLFAPMVVVIIAFLWFRHRNDKKNSLKVST